MRVQVLGLCRFSYPTNLTGFQSTHSSVDAQRAALYDPRRLAERLMWFEHVTLPSLRAQTDPDFTLILLLGEDFPEPFRSTLLALVRDISQIVPTFLPAREHGPVCNEVMRAARDPGADWIAEFRLDDDDAVARDYVAQTRAKCRWMQPMLKQFNRALLDFQRGIYLEANTTGIRIVPLVATYIAAGMTLFFKPSDPTSVMDYPHNKAWWRMPTLTFSDRLMFVRGVHTTNDSKIGYDKAILLPDRGDAMAATVRDRFGIDTEAFDAAWAAFGRGAARA